MEGMGLNKSWGPACDSLVTHAAQGVERVLLEGKVVAGSWVGSSGQLETQLRGLDRTKHPSQIIKRGARECP